MSRARQWFLTPTGGGGGGGGTTWGAITGTLSDQTDLNTALNGKSPTASPTFTGTATLSQYTTDHPIVAVDVALKRFSVAGDHQAVFNDGGGLSVTGSTGNDGVYEIASVSFTSPNTRITVVETIPSAVADGSIVDHMGTTSAKDGSIEYTAVTATNTTKWRTSIDSGGNLNFAQNTGFGYQGVDFQLRPGSGDTVINYDLILGGTAYESDGLTVKFRDETLGLTDITTGNATTFNHGLLPKLPGVSTQFLNGNGGWAVPNPARYFRAYHSASQNLPGGATTKVLFNTVALDSHSGYNTTLSRYVPGTAGVWRFTSHFLGDGGASGEFIAYLLFKNGVEIHASKFNIPTATTGPCGPLFTTIVSMNGTTDYVEVFLYVNGATAVTIAAGERYTSFVGEFVG